MTENCESPAAESPSSQPAPEFPLGEGETDFAALAAAAPIGDWAPVFAELRRELDHVSTNVRGTFYPRHCDVFRAFALTPLADVRVVILGQDPYFQLRRSGLPQATGLAFGVRRGEDIPVSLDLIFKAIRNCYGGDMPFNHGDLRDWALQGVLLLNTALTVRPKCAGSHTAVWQFFTAALLEQISRRRPGLIYVFWGGDAQKFARRVSGTKLTGVHPAERTQRFLRCTHFRDINDKLEEKGEPPIDWSLR